MERLEIRYDKKKLFEAIILIGIPLLGTTVIAFSTDIFYSNPGLAKIRIVFQTVVVLADAYLIYTLIKKREMFSNIPALVLTSNTIEVNEGGQWTIFHKADDIKVEVTKKKRGETQIDVLIVSNKNNSKEINIYPLEKGPDELKSIIERFG